MFVLIAGLVLFLGSHSVSIVAPQWRDGMVARLGEVPWKAAYGVIALVGFVLMVWGYGIADLGSDPLFFLPPWLLGGLNWVNAVLMLAIFPMLLAAYLPGRIQTALKHPMLAAVKVWALGHLLVNHTLVDVLLFGGLLAWAVVDRISIKRREKVGMVTPPKMAPATALNDVIVIAGGLALYVAFVVGLHTWLFGVGVGVF